MATPAHAQNGAVPPPIEIKNRGEKDPQFVVFKNVNILDSTGKEPYVGDVLVDGERFQTVGSSVDLAQYPNAKVLDGSGKTLMSGLCDAHAHPSWTNAATIDGLCDLEVEEHVIFTAQSVKCFLDCGYTMIYGAAAAKKRLDVVVRDAIKAGRIPGPRFIASGPEICTTGGAIIEGISLFADGPDQMRKTVRDLVRIGVDNVKLSMTGDEIHEYMRSEETYYTLEETKAAVEEAHRRGKRVMAHARSAESVKQCCLAGVDMIYHASFTDEEGMKMLEERKDKVYVAPAINFPLIAANGGATAFGVTAELAEKKGLRREVDTACKAMTEMHKRGIKVLPGGDYGFAWSPHGTYARDIEHLVKLFGFTPMEAIVAATATCGEAMGHPDKLGKVQPGYYADCILVDTPDLLKDVSVLQNRDKLKVIMLNGALYKNEL